MFCCMLLYVNSSFAIIFMGKRELVQGGQSRGQHDGVRGFPEPVKSFITLD